MILSIRFSKWPAKDLDWEIPKLLPGQSYSWSVGDEILGNIWSPTEFHCVII
jgi:hypothetical protein